MLGVNSHRKSLSKDDLTGQYPIESASMPLGEDEDEQTLPPLSLALRAHHETVRDLARFLYGQQLERPVALLSAHLHGCFAASEIVRRLQINRYVTSGVTPIGLASGFDQRYDQLARQARAAFEGLGPQAPRVDLADVLIKRPKPIKEAIRDAAALAARVRGDQTLLDGNHRTALLSFVLSLAETSVLLQPNFSIYRAYIILSAREHPGNVNNLLDSQARTDVTRALTQYARHKVRPGSPNWSYLESMAGMIRHLPIYASQVESTYRRLGIRRQNYLEPQMQDRQEQRTVWKALDARLRADIRAAFPHFHPGQVEKLQPPLQPYPSYA